MRILLSNDDGVFAEGLNVLHRVLSEVAEVTVVAPDRNCSGASNSLTLTNPLRATRLDNGFYSVNGTPSDCVHLGINQLMKQEPDLVVSGINHGANLGDDVIYSGTVAAATEGRHMGLPAIAVSCVGHQGWQFETAARVTQKIIERLKSHPLHADQILNINVPSVAMDALEGMEVTRLGRRHKAETMSASRDPWGREIFWYGPLAKEQDGGEGTDFYAVSHNKASVTPLTVDMTAHQWKQELAAWVEAI